MVEKSGMKLNNASIVAKHKATYNRAIEGPSGKDKI